MAALLISVIAIVALAGPSLAWQPNATVEAKSYIINLDLPPDQRWVDLVTIYKSSAPFIVDYFTDHLPEPVTKAIEKIMANLDPLLGDYGVEMRSIAKTFGVDLGVIVALNFAYELRKWAGGHPNITAPYSPKACTSIIAQDAQNNIYHGRNLDWDLPENLRNISVQIEFQRGGKTVYVGGCYVGFVGLLTAMSPGRFSISVNERDIGGSPILDSLTALLDGAVSVTHLVRTVADRAYLYDEAVTMLKDTSISAPVYFAVAGTKKNEGIVITRNRLFVRNLWLLPDTTGPAWYLLQTNYDHWLPDPVHDARRTYGDRFMDGLGEVTGATLDGVFSVLSTWPVMNNFTGQTVLVQPAASVFRTYVRYFF